MLLVFDFTKSSPHKIDYHTISTKRTQRQYHSTFNLIMENQPLTASPNDNVGKQKKGYKSVRTVSTAILLLGLVFYGGEYWGSHHARGKPDHSCNPPCVIIPAGLDHTVCLWQGDDMAGSDPGGTCQDGQPGALCDKTSDCVKPEGLTHPVCRGDGSVGVKATKKCQSGQPGALCGQTSDCVVQNGLTPPHPVCRKDRCQQ